MGPSPSASLCPTDSDYDSQSDCESGYLYDSGGRDINSPGTGHGMGMGMGMELGMRTVTFYQGKLEDETPKM